MGVITGARSGFAGVDGDNRGVLRKKEVTLKRQKKKLLWRRILRTKKIKINKNFFADPKVSYEMGRGNGISRLNAVRIK